MSVTELAPSLTHAHGNGLGGRVWVSIGHLRNYAVSVEYPREFCEAVRLCLTDGSFIECDGNVFVQRRHIETMWIDEASDA